MTDAQAMLLQKSGLFLMRHIHNLCVENDIKYYLIGGSALGAVRHKGIIPWDIDIDIAMPREDYSKFKELCKQKLDKRFEYRDYTNTKNLFSPHALVIIKGSSLKLTRNCIHKNDINEIFVDIFPLDTVPTELKDQKKQEKQIKFLNFLAYRKMGLTYSSSKLEHFAKKTVHILMKPISFHLLGKIRERVSTKYRNQNSGLICSMASHYRYTKQRMPIEIYGKPTLMEFSGESFFVPEKVHEYLTILYGDYMKLPPEEDRIEQLNYFKDVSVPPEIEKEL